MVFLGGLCKSQKSGEEVVPCRKGLLAPAQGSIYRHALFMESLPREFLYGEIGLLYGEGTVTCLAGAAR